MYWEENSVWNLFAILMFFFTQFLRFGVVRGYKWGMFSCGSEYWNFFIWKKRLDVYHNWFTVLIYPSQIVWILFSHLLYRLALIFTDAASNACCLSIVYGLKDRNFKNLLVFLRKIEDLTFFFIDSLRTEGKGKKFPFWAPTDLVCKDRACRGLFRQHGWRNHIL